MDSRKFIWKKTVAIVIGQAVCVSVMMGIFALLGCFARSVWLGGVCGGLIAVGNFFALALCADLAADKAEKGDVTGGQALLRFSYIGRLLLVAVLLFALVKSGWCHVVATVLPLVFNRPILILSEFFRKRESKV